MANNKFNYNVHLVPLKIDNDEQESFRNELYNIPYLLYQVETISNGDVIAINKPGGKRNFGRLSRDDFMVFVFNKAKHELWLISHNEILEDLINKFEYSEDETILLIKGLYRVCIGEEPDRVIEKLRITDTTGMSVETILKVYKWIWGQEDCNYPTKMGRWYSMNSILKQFALSEEDMK